jgi:hypothetical protein
LLIDKRTNGRRVHTKTLHRQFLALNSGLALAASACCLKAGGQTQGAALPDVIALITEVEGKQRAAELAQKDYVYREAVKIDELDAQKQVKKTNRREYDLFWLQGVQVRKLVSEDGKELTPDQQKKESDRIDKDVAKAKERRAKGDADGKLTDSQGNEEMTVSRMMELGSFTNERREVVDGRDTILVDFIGNPKAKGRNPIHDMAGTVAIDEKDKVLVQADGVFVSDFKVMAGLIAKIDKGTTFALRTAKVNDEVWLPSRFDLEGQARVLMVFNGHVRVEAHDTNYRKFKATSTILPDFSPAPADETKKPGIPPE